MYAGFCRKILNIFDERERESPFLTFPKNYSSIVDLFDHSKLTPRLPLCRPWDKQTALRTRHMHRPNCSYHIYHYNRFVELKKRKHNHFTIITQLIQQLKIAIDSKLKIDGFFFYPSKPTVSLCMCLLSLHLLNYSKIQN